MSEIDDLKSEIAMLQKQLDQGLEFETHQDPDGTKDATQTRREAIREMIRTLEAKLSERRNAR